MGRTPRPLFEAFGVEEVLDSTLSRRVDLPSGGYLMIDYAEALTVIDVNSGSFIGRGKGARLEDTITKTNLEAADEVVRQLRLRDIGGIIVIDFIDMARARNRDAVLKSLRKSLDEDRTKTFVVEISPLGLVEMTRQNVTDGVREIMTRPCPTCDGERRDQVRGDDRDRVRAADARPREADRGRGAADPDEPAGQRRVHRRRGAECCTQIEEETGKWFHFEGSEGLPLDHFAVVLEGEREEVLERAVPFREGEEVHVEIVEPHMYSPGDAVAKVDGYMISITGGGPYVGEKHLVRIEEAGRTSAVASLGRRAGRGRVRPNGAGAASRLRRWPRIEANRRRGRRGGRRRSALRRAQAAAVGRIFIGMNAPGMYAIVKTGGKQYRVEEGQTLLVERLPAPTATTRLAAAAALRRRRERGRRRDARERRRRGAIVAGTSAAPSSGSSSSSPSAATSGAPATARS